MRRKRNLDQVSFMMETLNLTILLFYSLICVATTYRICDGFGAYAFLASVRQLPPYPWELPFWSLSLYGILCLVIWGKNALPLNQLWQRLLVCIAEMLLCVGIIASTNFYYSGVALLVLADLVRYIQQNKIRVCFLAILISLYAFGQFEVISFSLSPIPFEAYLDYYNQFVRSVLTGGETILVSANTLLFVLSMILLFTGERAENQRIRKLNQQLNDANTRLREYAVELERMTEIRERNRLAREIHDTLGHTLTGIIMGADAALALFPIAPDEAQNRVQVIAQSARDGLTDIRRSIKALRPDALEQHSLEEALRELVEKFHQTTGAEILYRQEAGLLHLASDEEDFLYRVIQESMTNAVRHGLAGKIEVTLTREADLLTADIRDDGRGAENVTEGFGLRHMRERLELLGGTLSFGTRTDRAGEAHPGFFVNAQMPIRKRSEQHDPCDDRG